MQATNCDFVIPFAKKAGITSFQSLWTIKHALPYHEAILPSGRKVQRPCKVGHTGTLDKFASGLLIVCTGKLTKLVPKIVELDKVYEAVISFGQETDTLDPYGEVTKEAPLPITSKVWEAVNHFTATYEQVPPLFSAIKVNGQRASDRTRKGKIVTLQPRRVTIFNIDVISITQVDDKAVDLKAVFHVSKGTYIRSLARDIAEFAGSVAHLSSLKRTKVGNFCVDEAATCEQDVLSRALTMGSDLLTKCNIFGNEMMLQDDQAK